MTDADTKAPCQIYDVAAIEVRGDFLGQLFTLNNAADLHIQVCPTQPLHYAADRCLSQILHPLHAMSYRGGDQLLAHHGDGVEFVAGN